MVGRKKSSGLWVANKHYHDPLPGFRYSSGQYGAPFPFLSIHFVAVIRIGDYFHNPFGKDVAVPINDFFTVPGNFRQ